MTQFPNIEIVVGSRSFTNEQVGEAKAFASAEKLEARRLHTTPGNHWDEFLEVEYAISSYSKEENGDETLIIDGPRGKFSLLARNTHDNATPVAISFRPYFFRGEHQGYQFSSIRYADGVSSCLGSTIFTFDQPALKAL